MFVKETEDNEHYTEQLKKENAEYEKIIEGLKQEEEGHGRNKFAIKYWQKRIEHNIKKINILQED